MTNPDVENNSKLTPQQFQACCLLTTGESVTAVAEAVGVSRQTVSGWQNHNRDFRSELTRLKSELWRDTRERLRALVPKCLDVLAELLEDDDKRIRMSAAGKLLSLSGIDNAKDNPQPPFPVPARPQTADEQFAELQSLGVFDRQ